MSIKNELDRYQGMYAVIFSSTLKKASQAEIEEYESMANLMLELAEKQPGFLGIESTRGDDGLGISVSYWQDLESIASWRDNELHALARRKGKEQWYKTFSLKVSKIERAYSFES